MILRGLLTLLILVSSLPQANASNSFVQNVLPASNQIIHLSQPFAPCLLKGIKVSPNDPFAFDFIIDPGQSLPEQRNYRQLITYFLSGLAIPDGDLWVNLSPYEHNRIIPESFGKTEMGRNLLAQDYILKQITSSLMYPNDAVGRRFWREIYSKAQAKYGTTTIPVNTFNKVWIVPQKAKVYQHQNSAYIVDAQLKVMLEEDYLVLKKKAPASMTHALGSDIVKEIILPLLQKEVNTGSHFAQLRQIYNALILSTWYKKNIHDSLISSQFVNRNQVNGLAYKEGANIEAIYQNYLKAFRKGIYNFVKEEVDPLTGQAIPRKYFSGGAKLDMALDVQEQGDLPPILHGEVVHAKLQAAKSKEPLLNPSGHDLSEELHMSPLNFPNKEALVDLIAKAERLETDIHHNHVLYSKEDAILVKISPLGSRRYFNLNHQWFLTTDALGHPTAWADYLPTGQMSQIHFLALTGELLIAKEGRNFDGRTLIDIAIERTGEDIYHFIAPLGMEAIVKALIPGGYITDKKNVLPRAAGWGLHLMDIIAQLAQDHEQPLKFDGPKDTSVNPPQFFPVKQDYFFLLREVVEPVPQIANQETFEKNLDYPFEPHPVDFIVGEKATSLVVDPSTHEVIRAYDGRQYIAIARKLTGEKDDGIVPSASGDGFNILDHGIYKEKIDLWGRELPKDEALNASQRNGGIDLNQIQGMIEIKKSKNTYRQKNKMTTAHIERLNPIIVGIEPLKNIQTFLETP